MVIGIGLPFARKGYKAHEGGGAVQMEVCGEGGDRVEVGGEREVLNEKL